MAITNYLHVKDVKADLGKENTKPLLFKYHGGTLDEFNKWYDKIDTTAQDASEFWSEVKRIKTSKDSIKEFSALEPMTAKNKVDDLKYQQAVLTLDSNADAEIMARKLQEKLEKEPVSASWHIEVKESQLFYTYSKLSINEQDGRAKVQNIKNDSAPTSLKNAPSNPQVAKLLETVLEHNEMAIITKPSIDGSLKGYKWYDSNTYFNKDNPEVTQKREEVESVIKGASKEKSKAKNANRESESAGSNIKNAIKTQQPRPDRESPTKQAKKKQEVTQEAVTETKQAKQAEQKLEVTQEPASAITKLLDKEYQMFMLHKQEAEAKASQLSNQFIAYLENGKSVEEASRQMFAATKENELLRKVVIASATQKLREGLELNKENTQLKDTNSNLEKRVELNNETISKQAQDIEHMKVAGAQQDKLIKEHENRYNQLAERIRKLKENNSNLTQERDAFKNTADEQNDFITEMRAKLAELEAQVANLSEENSTLKTQNSALEAENKDQAKLIDTLKEEVKGHETKQNSNQSEIQDLQKQIESLKKDFNASRERELDLTKSVTALNTQIAELNNNYADSLSHYTSLINNNEPVVETTAQDALEAFKDVVEETNEGAQELLDAQREAITAKIEEAVESGDLDTLYNIYKDKDTPADIQEALWDETEISKYEERVIDKSEEVETREDETQDALEELKEALHKEEPKQEDSDNNEHKSNSGHYQD